MPYLLPKAVMRIIKLKSTKPMLSVRETMSDFVGAQEGQGTLPAFTELTDQDGWEGPYVCIHSGQDRTVWVTGVWGDPCAHRRRATSGWRIGEGGASRTQ